MPAPKLDKDITLLDLRTEIVFSAIACRHDAHTRQLARRFETLLTRWTEVFQQQLACWDAQTEADYGVGLADDRLDDDVDGFHAALFHKCNQQRSDPHYELYFSVRPARLKRPVLGAELETVRAWLTLLPTEDADLRGHHEAFVADVRAADTAVEAASQADNANRQFRAVGGLAEFLTEVQTVRDDVYAALEGIRAEEKLPRDYADGFFRHATRPALSDEARKVKAEERAAARKAAADLTEQKRLAREKLRDAQRALAELDRKPS